MNSKQDINQLTLTQLSSAAAELWSAIENCEEDTELEKLLHQQLELQDLTESKVDAFCYVQDQLKIDLEAWSARLNAVSQIYSAVIERRRKQLEKLKQYLLRLHTLGLLPTKLIGRERRIQFQKNSRPTVTAIEETACPAEFLEIRYIPLKDKILEAHASGQDVSDFAQVEAGKHVRFYFEKAATKKRS